MLTHLIELLREDLDAAEQALFQELASRDLQGLTEAINAELEYAAPFERASQVLNSVRLALIRENGKVRS